jgi:DNA polymerase-3 subunit gamma/tau
MIDEVHQLTTAAFNAMLKTLEEPPEYVKFILATTDPQKVPVTVLSRCLQFNLKSLSPQLITSHMEHILKEEGISYEVPALSMLAHGAAGSMRDGLSLLDQAIAFSAGDLTLANVREMLGTIDTTTLMRLLGALANKDAAGMMAVADEMGARSLSYAQAMKDMSAVLHRIAMAQIMPASVPADDPEAESLLALAKAFTPEEVQLYYQIAIHGRNDMHLAPDEYSGFTMALLRMLAFAPADTPANKIPPVIEAKPAQPAAASAPQAAPAAPKAVPAAPAAPAPRPAAPKPAAKPAAPAPKSMPAPKPAAAPAPSVPDDVPWDDDVPFVPDDEVIDEEELYRGEPVAPAEGGAFGAAQNYAPAEESRRAPTFFRAASPLPDCPPFKPDEWLNIAKTLSWEPQQQVFVLNAELQEKTADLVRLKVRSDFAAVIRGENGKKITALLSDIFKGCRIVLEEGPIQGKTLRNLIRQEFHAERDRAFDKMRKDPQIKGFSNYFKSDLEKDSLELLDSEGNPRSVD